MIGVKLDVKIVSGFMKNMKPHGASDKSPSVEHETPSIRRLRAFLIMRYMLQMFGITSFSLSDNGEILRTRLRSLILDYNPAFRFLPPDRIAISCYRSSRRVVPRNNIVPFGFFLLPTLFVFISL